MALCVTGTIGDAAIGLKLRLEPDAAWAQALSPAARSHLLDRYLHPQPRNVLADAVRAHARAAMDVSDGLAGDAAKLARAQADAADHCHAVIEAARVPLSDAAREAIALEPALLAAALTGGDDYELLIACEADAVAALQGAGAGMACRSRGSGGSRPARARRWRSRPTDSRWRSARSPSSIASTHEGSAKPRMRGRRGRGMTAA